MNINISSPTLIHLRTSNLRFSLLTLGLLLPPLPFSNGNFVCCARIVMKRLVNYYWDFSSVRESSSCHQFWLLINCRQRVRAGQFLESLTSFKCDYISRSVWTRRRPTNSMSLTFWRENKRWKFQYFHSIQCRSRELVTIDFNWLQKCGMRKSFVVNGRAREEGKHSKLQTPSFFFFDL